MQLKYENTWFRNFIVFSLLYGVNAVDMLFSNEADRKEVWLVFLVILLFYLFTFGHNYFLLAPYFLKKKIRKYSILALLYALAGAVLFHFGVGYFDEQEESFPFISDLLSTIVLLAFGSGLYILNLWINDNLIAERKRALATEKELATLKQQMNPHFLLNALNNLYGVALSSPQKVPDKILELSDLLTYQIETSKKEWISLLEEMTFAEKFLRYMEWKTKGLTVEITMEGEIRDYRITPMIFLPLLENAVKYSLEMPSPSVAVAWIFHENKIEVTIINNYESSSRAVTSTKMGVENLQRRLELYHPQHELTLTKKEHQFTAKLLLWNLSSAA